MSAENAKKLLKEYVKKEEFLIHNLEVGAAMRALAEHFNQDPDLWQSVGLLHDLDIEIYGEDIRKHTIIAEKILKENGFDNSFIETIKSHNDALNIPRTTLIQKCLYSADGLTGLIHAYVLMRPDKNIQNASVKSILKKLKDKSFAKSVNRDAIRSIESTANIPIKEFIGYVLEGMQKYMD